MHFFLRLRFIFYICRMFADFFTKKTSFASLNLTRDNHCHLLPGVDDGVQTFDDSVRILGMMEACGFRNVTLTPHINPEIFQSNTEDYLRRRYDEFISKLPETPIRLKLGAEYMVIDGFENRNPLELIQFEDGKVLIEMSYLFPSKNIEDSIFNLTLAGLKPVIAHPERYLYFAGNLKKFEKYHDMGADFQLNLLSLTGAYGRESVRIMKYILKNGWYTYFGSDTHTVQHFDNVSHIVFPLDMLSSLQFDNR